jgi:hypothetical protein
MPENKPRLIDRIKQLFIRKTKDDISDDIQN